MNQLRAEFGVDCDSSEGIDANWRLLVFISRGCGSARRSFPIRRSALFREFSLATFPIDVSSIYQGGIARNLISRKIFFTALLTHNIIASSHGHNSFAISFSRGSHSC